MVTCLVCGKQLNLINGLHLRSHGMTAQEYRARFPDAEVSSSDFRKKRSKVMTERWQDPEIRAHTEESCRQAQLKAWEGNDERRKAQAERAPIMVEKIWSDPIKRKDMSQRRSDSALEMWQRDDYRELMFISHSITMRRLWRDPEFRKKVRSPKRWTGPERVVRGWLEDMGLYKGEGASSFYPHCWLPTESAGFAMEGDFADFVQRLVLHVDGVYWHRIPANEERDQRNNQWCDENDWLYLRITDVDIKERPRWCRSQILELVSRRLPGLD